MTGKEEFAARLARIQSGKGVNTLGQIHVGSIEDERPSVAQVIEAAAARGGSVLTLIPALLLGGLALFAGKVGAFHLQAAGSLPDTLTPATVTFGIALVVAYACGVILRLTGLARRAATGLGLIAAASLFHNLAHLAPGPMGQAFSAGWVAATQAEAPLGTFWFQDRYVALLPEPVPEAEAIACAPPKAEVTILRTDHARKAPKASHKAVSVAEPPAEEAPCAP